MSLSGALRSSNISMKSNVVVVDVFLQRGTCSSLEASKKEIQHRSKLDVCVEIRLLFFLQRNKVAQIYYVK